MNFYPSWIHSIPETLEALALRPDERIDRRRAEELFDLSRSAAHELLRRLGAERRGKRACHQPQHADSALHLDCCIAANFDVLAGKSTSPSGYTSKTKGLMP